MKQTSIIPRKPARQERSKRTVRAILKAAAHILKRDSLAGFTTNHIATEANVSVGSVYQYFPNKHAILFRLMCMQIEHGNATRPISLDTGADISLEKRISISVKWQFDVRREDPLLFQRLYEVRGTILSSKERNQFDRLNENAVYEGLKHHSDEIGRTDLKTASLVVSQFLLSAIQTATASRPELLEDPDYETQIVNAILSYLR